MANRYAVASGNWSDVATWDGGVSLPGAGDNVRPNGFTVTIDQDITVTLLTNNASSPAVAGGGFQVTAGTRVINAQLSMGGNATPVLTFSGSDPLTINGSFGHITSPGTTVLRTGTGTLNINGNIPVTSSSGSVHYQVRNTSNGTINIVGNVTGGGGGSGISIQLETGTVTLNIVGDVTMVSSSYAIHVPSGVATINITGDVSASTAAVLGAIFFPVGATITVNGNVTNSAGTGIFPTANCTITINGNVTTGSSTLPAIYSNQVAGANSTIVVNGNVTAGNNAPGIALTGGVSSTGSVLINGEMIAGAAGHQAVMVPKLLIPAHPTNLRHQYTVTPNTTYRSLYTQGQNIGQPDEADVRHATVYGADNELTGTCRVPSADTVSIGVLVDNTVGTLVAAVDPEDIANAVWGAARADYTVGGTFGEAVRAVDSSGNAIFPAASYTAPPTAAAIRAEIDANSSKLDVTVGSRLASLSYTAPNNAGIASIKAVTDKLQFNGEDMLLTAITKYYDTGTSDYELFPEGFWELIVDAGQVEASNIPPSNVIADHILRRNAADARDSIEGDAVQERSLLGAISKLVNRFDAGVTQAGKITVYEEDDTTPFYTQTIVTNSSAEPITSINTD